MVVSPGSEPGGRWFDSNPRSFFVMRPWCNGSTAGSNPARSGFKSLGACFQNNNSPVAQRQRQLSYKESIGGSSPSRTTLLGQRGCVSSWSRHHFISRVIALQKFSWSSGVLACLSRRRSPVQIRSGTLFQIGMVRKPVKRRSSNLRDCLWVRLPPVPLIWGGDPRSGL